MRFVPVKGVDQQCARALQRTRELLTRQRTQLGNAMRGHLYEMGIVAAEGAAGLSALVERIEAADPAIPEALRSSLACLARQWRAVDEEADRLKAAIHAQVKTNEAAVRLMAIPGVGPIIAHAVIGAIGDGGQFASGRDFAAWLGLTRKNYDTGGKHRNTGHISKAGDRSLRSLLVLGASAWLRHVRAKPEKGSAWIRGVLGRRPVKVAVIAQAAKTARIVWAMLRSNKPYRAPLAA
jgi:transposase